MAKDYMRPVKRAAAIGGGIGFLVTIALCLNVAVESYIDGRDGTMILLLVLALPLAFFGMRIGFVLGRTAATFFGAMTVDLPKGPLPKKPCSKCGAEITKTYIRGAEDGVWFCTNCNSIDGASDSPTSNVIHTNPREF